MTSSYALFQKHWHSIKWKENKFCEWCKSINNTHSATLPKSKTSMVCNIDRESFFMLSKCTWVGVSSASCHITNDDVRMNDVSTSMILFKTAQAIWRQPKRISFAQFKRGWWNQNFKHSTACEVSSKVITNLLCLPCELLHGSKLCSEEKSG